MFGTSIQSLAEALQKLLVQPDFFTVPKRTILRFLCDQLRLHGYVAMSPEELLIRNHLMDGEKEFRLLVRVDCFKHQWLFERLGFSSKDLVDAITICVDLDILEQDTTSDGQVSFTVTCWKNKNMSLHEALFLLKHAKV